MNKREEHDGVSNRFAAEHTTKTGGMGGAFGFTPSPSAGGVIVEPKGEYIRINGVTTFVPEGKMIPIVAMDFRHTVNHNFHLLDKDKKHIIDGEHLGMGDFTDASNDTVSNVEYIIPID